MKKGLDKSLGLRINVLSTGSSFKSFVLPPRHCGVCFDGEWVL